ncbi:unnamed protein product [Prorocentrum cordatum]|uniref:Uncharacterized protein n=1 Tax=Prorocentrum cordatum TaxID=2364126 RepID=A0ABN9VCV0_9DINO|nr:unnamed protein product [Polarella glacialis]
MQWPETIVVNGVRQNSPYIWLEQGKFMCKPCGVEANGGTVGVAAAHLASGDSDDEAATIDDVIETIDGIKNNINELQTGLNQLSTQSANMYEVLSVLELRGKTEQLEKVQTMEFRKLLADTLDEQHQGVNAVKEKMQELMNVQQPLKADMKTLTDKATEQHTAQGELTKQMQELMNVQQSLKADMKTLTDKAAEQHTAQGELTKQMQDLMSAQQSLQAQMTTLPALASLANFESRPAARTQKSWQEAQKAERDEELGRGAAGAAAKQSAPGVMSPAGLQ